MNVKKRDKEKSRKVSEIKGYQTTTFSCSIKPKEIESCVNVIALNLIRYRSVATSGKRRKRSKGAFLRIAWLGYAVDAFQAPILRFFQTARNALHCSLGESGPPESHERNVILNQSCRTQFQKKRFFFPPCLLNRGYWT